MAPNRKKRISATSRKERFNDSSKSVHRYAIQIQDRVPIANAVAALSIFH